jgi:polysaccharide pyruvyl transferase WcaK-like protein
MSRTLLVEAYSPRNLGDAELVIRSVEYCKRRYGPRIAVAATDADGVRMLLGAGTRVVSKCLTRATWLESKSLVWLAQEVASLLLATLVARCPGSAWNRRRMVRWIGKASRRAWLVELSEADAVVAVGGGYLGDRYLRESIVALLVMWIGERLGASVETMPISVSGMRRFTLRMAFRSLGGAVRWRAREEPTELLLLGLGLHVERWPDLAWSNAAAAQADEKRVGAVVAPVGSAFYVGGAARGMSAAVSELDGSLPKDESILFVAMHRYDHALRDGGDDRACRELIEELAIASPERPTRLVDADSYGDVLRVMAQSRVAICERLHAGLAAITMGTPARVLGYEPKHSGVLQGAGLSFLTDISLTELLVREDFWRQEMLTAANAESKHLVQLMRPANEDSTN